MKCPLCGSKVTYEGLFSLACAGRDCQNWDKTTSALPAIGTVWRTIEDPCQYVIRGYVYDHVLVAPASYPAFEIPVKWDPAFWVEVL